MIAYEDESLSNIQTIFDSLLCMNGHIVSDWLVWLVRQNTHDRITLKFLQEKYLIFTDPTAATSLDLSTVLKHMVECGHASTNDMF